MQARRSRSPNTGRTNLDSRREAWGRSDSQASANSIPSISSPSSPHKRTGKIFHGKKNPYGVYQKMNNSFPPPQSSSRAQLTRPAPTYGTETERISHELEWDDIKANGREIDPDRLTRAKTVAAHQLAGSLHKETWDNLDQLKDVSADDLVDKMVTGKNFSKQLRTLKYKDRLYSNQSSSNMNACLDVSLTDPFSSGRLPSVYERPPSPSRSPPSRLFTPRNEFLVTKPYMDRSMRSTGARTVSQMSFDRKVERQKIGEEWLEKDNDYMPPGVSFKRVNAFYRDSYVGRDGVTPISDPYVGRMSLMKA